MVTGDDIRRVFRQHLGTEATEWLELCSPLLNELNVARLPGPNETAAIAFHNPKTAALCFDRIWAGVNTEIPDEIGFCGVLPPEAVLIFTTGLLVTLNETQFDAEAREPFITATAAALMRLLPPGTALPDNLSIDDCSRVLSDKLGNEYGFPVVTVYHSVTQRDREYKPGDRAAIMAILENVPIVDESRLQWEQVLELRRDKAMLARFRRFVHWLDAQMVSKPISYIEDEISLRLEDFHRATRAHGLATTIGILQVTVDSIALFGGTAAVAKLVTDAGTPGALAAGACAMTAGGVLPSESFVSRGGCRAAVGQAREAACSLE